ncbi:MAG: hydrogenase maturation nickel metallochaperone HypA [Chromatiaceae bacterium]|nr:MAG: hydrogenase maturation nickel metallochaperone HypA [Chromatiaceae bacterium]
MHELSICLSLLDQVTRIAREQRADAVERILVRIGPLAGVEASLLQHAWPLAAAGSSAADAELLIEETAVRIACNDCGAESAAQPNRLLCTACGSHRTRLISGDELLLARLELRIPDPPPA